MAIQLHRLVLLLRASNFVDFTVASNQGNFFQKLCEDALRENSLKGSQMGSRQTIIAAGETEKTPWTITNTSRLQERKFQNHLNCLFELSHVQCMHVSHFN